MKAESASSFRSSNVVYVLLGEPTACDLSTGLVPRTPVLFFAVQSEGLLRRSKVAMASQDVNL